MADHPLSVQLYTLKERILEDLPGTLLELARIGFTTVEPHKFADTAAMADALSAAGLEAPSAHARVLGPDSTQLFESAQALGIKTLIQPITEVEAWQTSDGVQDLARRINEVSTLAQQYGIQVGYHNHAFELESMLNGRHALEVFADHLEDDVVLEVDTFWAAVGGADPVALLNRLGERVSLLHIKDGPISKDTSTQLPVGKGEMPINEILAAAPWARPVVELDAYAGDPLDAVAESFTYLTEITR